MKKKPREFNRKLKREYRKGYAQRSLEVRKILRKYMTEQVIDYTNAGMEVSVEVSSKDLVSILKGE